MKAKQRKTPAAELRRLARIAELARAARRSERALTRAMRSAHERGIGTRRIAGAAGLSHQTVWRSVRPGDGHGPDATGPEHAANRATKPKGGGK